MRTVAKKIISSCLILVMVINSNCYAMNSNYEICEDVYKENYSEIVCIDGEEIQYKYEYNENGQRKITIIDLTSNKTEELVFDIDPKLNDKVCESNLLTTIYSVDSRSDAYKYIGSTTKTITWEEGASVAIIAALIAGVIGITATMVIAKIGSVVLGGMSAASGTMIGAVVSFKTYEMVAGKTTSYKFIWSVKPNGGKKYGEYTSYMEG